MPIPVKPCEGRFSDEVLQILSKNRDRSQWALHTCEVCGTSVGATIDKGKWVPEQHWPSVKYPARTEKKQNAASRHHAIQDDSVLAESASR